MFYRPPNPLDLSLADLNDVRVRFEKAKQVAV